MRANETFFQTGEWLFLSYLGLEMPKLCIRGYQVIHFSPPHATAANLFGLPPK